MGRNPASCPDGLPRPKAGHPPPLAESIRAPASPACPRQQLGSALVLMGGAVVARAAFWLVPTELVGKGVLLLPDNAGLLDARAAGQVRRLPIRVGDRVQRGQVLVELYLSVLEKELEQQRANLLELERQNRTLDERDRLRLQSEQVSVDTSLAKLQSDRERYGSLRDT